MAKGSQYRKFTRTTAGNIGYFTILILFGLFTVFPLFYCIITSLKPLDELLIFPPRFWVARPTFDNYKVLPALLSNLEIPLSRYVFNSLFIAIATTIVSIIAGSMAAFTFSKSKIKGAKFSFTLITTMMLYNHATLGVPQYLIFSTMGIIDTYWVYILPAIPSTVNCFLMKQFMDASVNDSLLEAARIDGAGVGGMYWKIVMPIMKPAIMTVLLFSFQAMWSVVPGGTIFSEELKTLPYVMSSVAAGGIARSGSSMAITVILMLPPILVFVVTQSNVLETMGSSGIKE
ncbi:MAG: carbohydrate ABC transporter permease [Ruminococcaceae bacterium]|nr:carbohydrate ABC transporter permease [Oscillospiraceae bacterium]